jgi:hypothetical protein
VREGKRTNAIHLGLEGGTEGIVAGGREEKVAGKGSHHEFDGEKIETVELGGQIGACVVQRVKNGDFADRERLFGNRR